MLFPRQTAIFSVVGCTCLAACSLLVNTSNLENAKPGPNDAGDAASISPTVGEGDGSAEAGRVSGCAGISPKPKFCVDFDDLSRGLGADWSRINADTPNLAVAFDSTQAFSAPRSAKMTMTDAVDCSYTRLERAFEGVAVQNRIDAHVRLWPSSPWTTDRIPLVISIFSPGKASECGLLVNFGSNGRDISSASLAVQYGTGPQEDDFELAGIPSVDMWTSSSTVTATSSFPSPWGRSLQRPCLTHAWFASKAATTPTSSTPKTWRRGQLHASCSIFSQNT